MLIFHALNLLTLKLQAHNFYNRVFRIRGLL